MLTRTLLLFLSMSLSSALAQSGPSLISQSMLGGTGSEDIGGHLVTADGGIVVLGSTGSTDGDLDGMPNAQQRKQPWDLDIWLVKLGPSREIVWQQVIGGSNRDSATYISQTSDGGFLISASTDSKDGDFVNTPGSGFTVLIKTTSGGMIEWTRKVDLFRAYSFKEFSDGMYRFCGISLSHGKAVVGKIDQTGDLVWEKQIQSDSAKFHTACFDIFETSDGFILSGFLDDQTQWIAGFLDQGQPLWEQLVGDLYLEWHIPMAVSAIQTKDGGFVSVLTNYSEENVRVVRFKKHRPDGTVALTKKFTPLNRTSYGIGVVEVDSDEFVICGVADSGSRDIVLMGVTGAGVEQWMKVLGGSGVDNVSRSITFDGDSYTFSGMTASNDGDMIGNHGSSDIWLMTLGPSASVVSSSALPYLLLYPSPADEYVDIRSPITGTGTFTIADMAGRVIRTMHHVPIDEVRLFVGDISAGAYILTVLAGNGQQVQRKFIKR